MKNHKKYSEYFPYLLYSLKQKELIPLFKLILHNNKITYGLQDKVNITMKTKPEVTVLRHNIDDIKLEVMKLKKDNPEAEIVFVGV